MDSRNLESLVTGVCVVVGIICLTAVILRGCDENCVPCNNIMNMCVLTEVTEHTVTYTCSEGIIQKAVQVEVNKEKAKKEEKNNGKNDGVGEHRQNFSPVQPAP